MTTERAVVDVLMLLLAVGASLGAWWWWRQRRTRQLAAVGSLEQAARVLGGQVQHSTRAPGLGAVAFEDDGVRFRLLRERRAQPGQDQAQCVIELVGGAYQGPELVLVNARSMRATLPPTAQVWHLPWLDLEDRALALAAEDPLPALRLRLDDDAQRALVRHALDHRGARLRLSPRGCWFECEGFGDNGELVAATARTAARALSALLAPAASPRR